MQSSFAFWCILLVFSVTYHWDRRHYHTDTLSWFIRGHTTSLQSSVFLQPLTNLPLDNLPTLLPILEGMSWCIPTRPNLTCIQLLLMHLHMRQLSTLSLHNYQYQAHTLSNYQQSRLGAKLPRQQRSPLPKNTHPLRSGWSFTVKAFPPSTPPPQGTKNTQAPATFTCTFSHGFEDEVHDSVQPLQ